MCLGWGLPQMAVWAKAPSFVETAGKMQHYHLFVVLLELVFGEPATMDGVRLYICCKRLCDGLFVCSNWWIVL